jgi:hypothetical protein
LTSSRELEEPPTLLRIISWVQHPFMLSVFISHHWDRAIQSIKPMALDL